MTDILNLEPLTDAEVVNDAFGLALNESVYNYCRENYASLFESGARMAEGEDIRDRKVLRAVISNAFRMGYSVRALEQAKSEQISDPFQDPNEEYPTSVFEVDSLEERS